MRIVSIEEHFLTPQIITAWEASPLGHEGTGSFDQGEIGQRLKDLGDIRLALMDESGIDVQVLSVTSPALHKLQPEESIRLAHETNDLVSSTIAKNPTRFQGFAVLHGAAPQQAALELKRAVDQLGLCGAVVCGRTRDKNLDHPDFLFLLQTSADLRVPLFIHPQIPQVSVRKSRGLEGRGRGHGGATITVPRGASGR